MQRILQGRKHLPKGIFINEDLPEEWIDRCRILKPIFNAAKRNDTLKHKTHLNKDKLIIDGRTFTVAPNSNLNEVSSFVDLPSTCQRGDRDSGLIVFLGSHSIYSNFYPTPFVVNNTVYSCAEQMIQSEKATLFDDNLTHHRIMKEHNPHRIKKLGSKVKGFNMETWRKRAKQIVHKAVLSKFSQNSNLKGILLSSGSTIIAESSTDPYWGTGLHLHDRSALNQRAWKNVNGGAMCEIISKVRSDLKARTGEPSTNH